MKNMFSQVLFLNYIFHSYLLLLVLDSIHQKKLLEIEKNKLAMQKENLDTAKKEIGLLEEFMYFIKTSYEESKQRDKRGFFG